MLETAEAVAHLLRVALLHPLRRLLQCLARRFLSALLEVFRGVREALLVRRLLRTRGKFCVGLREFFRLLRGEFLRLRKILPAQRRGHRAHALDRFEAAREFRRGRFERLRLERLARRFELFLDAAQRDERLLLFDLPGRHFFAQRLQFLDDSAQLGILELFLRLVPVLENLFQSPASAN